jgi:hypothetical protein
MRGLSSEGHVRNVGKTGNVIHVRWVAIWSLWAFPGMWSM